MDALAIDHWVDLDDPLSDHLHQLWVRLLQSISRDDSKMDRRAFRHQSGRQHSIHADLFRAAKRPPGCSGHCDCLDDNHLEHGRRLAPRQMGRTGSSALFCLGIDCDGTAVEYHMVELG